MVSGSLPVTERGEHQGAYSSFLTYTEQFYEQFPYYLSIGMTYEQFWEGDPMLTKYYRKADEIRKERLNQELWLQGMYVYEAFCDASPLLHAFAKRGVKPHPYSETPYPITQKQHKRVSDDREKKVSDKGLLMMEALMNQNNKKFKKTQVEGGESNG